MSVPTILLVDDDDRFREDLKLILAEELHDVDLEDCSGAAEAASILAQRTADVVVADMVMEDTDSGFDLVHLIKKKNPRTQVIVLTAFPSVGNAVRCMRAGCFEYLTKPQPVQTIVATIHKALDLSQRSDARDSLTERLIVSDWDLLRNAESAAKRASALESLCGLVFGTIDGWHRVESRVRSKTEEIDVVIVNESTEEFWRRFGTLILVECKNWSRKQKPGRKDFDAFYSKMKRRGKGECRLGFFVSLNGVTKTFDVETDRISKESVTIVPVNEDNLWRLICASNRSEYLKGLVAERLLQ